MFWIKSKGKLGDALALHQCVVAYGSDHNLLGTVPLAHGATWFSRGSSNSRIAMMASLDHSMWFHCPFRADEWMLYVCERYVPYFICSSYVYFTHCPTHSLKSSAFPTSPRSGCDRGLTFGRIYKEDGTLAVSVAQEGVVRLKANQSDPKL